MEYKFEKIEKIFVEYIVNLIGPNQENEFERSEKLKIMKNLITNSFSTEDNIIPHIFCFGSFPMKTYLPESDMDITIILEDKQTKSIITNYSYEFLNKILSLIQNCLEYYAQESGYPPLISEISLIMADVKLIKCKYEDLAFDISINNFVGLCKLILIKSFEKLLINPGLFKRSLFIIKAWCYYEGSLLGSNLGLLASYALEIIVMYIFNKNNENIKTEIDALCFFFEKVIEFNWEKDILSILGNISQEAFQEEFKINNLPIEKLMMNIIEKNQVFQYDNLKQLNLFFEKFADLDKIQNFNSNKKLFILKFMNIIDPMFNNNNLGKSVNFHNYNRFVKVIEYEMKYIQNLKEMRTKNTAPDIYLNQLLHIFEKIITNNTPELFFYNLPQPRIFISANDFEDEELNNYGNIEYNFNNNIQYNYPHNINNNNYNYNFHNNYANYPHNNIDFAPGFGVGFIENPISEFSTNDYILNSNPMNQNNAPNLISNKDEMKNLIDEFNKLFLNTDKENLNKQFKTGITGEYFDNNINNNNNENNINFKNDPKDNLVLNAKDISKEYKDFNKPSNNGNNDRINNTIKINQYPYKISEDKVNITQSTFNENNNKESISNNNFTRVERKIDIFNDDFVIDENKNFINKDVINSNNLNSQRDLKKLENNNYGINNSYRQLHDNQSKGQESLNSFLWPNSNEIASPNDIYFSTNLFSDFANKNLITKEILDFISQNINNFRQSNFSSENEIIQIENFLQSCKFDN